MSTNASEDRKRNATRRESGSQGLAPVAEIQPVGQCDTPQCRKDAVELTPAGHVCPTCLRELEREFQRARDRDDRADARRVGR